jgi:tetratricopeptide (TPR) repeat protein
MGLLLAAVILLGVTPGHSQAIPYEQNPMRLGQKALDNDQLEEAINQFRAAVKDSPDSFRPRYWLGEALRLNGNLGEARSTFEQAIKLDPTASDGYAGLGNTALAIGDTALAVQSFRKAIQINNSYWDAHYGLGRIALANGDTSGARDHFRHGENKSDEGEILYATGMGMLALAQGKTDEAELFLLKAKAERPNNSEIRRALADLYVAKNVPGLAIAEYEKAVELQPRNAQVRYELGRLYVRTKLYNDGLKEFQEVTKIDSTYTDAYMQMGRLYARAKRWQEAAWSFGRFVTFKPTAEAYTLLAEAHREDGKTRASCAALAEAAKLDAASPLLLRDLARCRFDVRDTTQAAADYDVLLAGNPQVLEGQDYLNIGKTCLNRKQTDRAREHFLQAAAIDSTLRDVHFYLGYMDLVAKNFESSASHFDREIAANPKSLNSYMYRGMALIQIKRTEEAITSMRTAIEIDSTFFQGRLWLGQTLASADSLKAAGEQYKKALELKEGNPDALRGLGFVYLRQKRYDEAIGPLKQAVDAQPDNVQGYVWYGQGLLLAGRTPEAKTVFQRVLTKDPGNKDAQSGLNVIKAREEQGGE